MNTQPLVRFLSDLINTTNEVWQDRALCAQIASDDLFFPERGCPTTEAKSVCARCEVREQCLDFALTEDIRFGVWGGTSERERRALRTERRAPKLPVTEASVTLLRDPARVAAVLSGDTNQAA